MNMKRDRPYDGQRHTDSGIRGKTLVEGLTFRDIRDCFIRGYVSSLDFELEGNRKLINEGMKGEKAKLDENSLFQGKGFVDLLAVAQNMACEMEKMMGIYPNVPTLRSDKKKGEDDA